MAALEAVRLRAPENLKEVVEPATVVFNTSWT
jgi:hypothetical protein